MKKGLCGLKQGWGIWNEKNDFETSQNYTPSDAYIKVQEEEFIILALYVDDTLITLNSSTILAMEKRCSSKSFTQRITVR